MKKILIFLGIVILISAGIFFELQKTNIFEKISETPKEVKEIKIGFITDIHGYRTSKANGDIRDDSRIGLESFVKKMNEEFHPNFVVDGGDLIEGSKRKGEKSFGDWKLLATYFSKLNAPAYHVIGNHELRGFTKEEWVKINNYEKSYYYFDQDDLRVFVLDGNENEKIGPEAVGAYFLSEEQFNWLEEKLSESKKMRKIVFIHYPVVLKYGLATTSSIATEQAEKLRRLFSENKVLAVFSGHVETLELKEIDGVKYFVIPGQERSKNRTVNFFETFAEIKVKNEVAVELYYKSLPKEEYKKITVPSAEYDEMQKIYESKGTRAIEEEEDED